MSWFAFGDSTASNLGDEESDAATVPSDYSAIPPRSHTREAPIVVPQTNEQRRPRRAAASAASQKIHTQSSAKSPIARTKRAAAVSNVVSELDTVVPAPFHSSARPMISPRGQNALLADAADSSDDDDDDAEASVAEFARPAAVPKKRVRFSPLPPPVHSGAVPTPQSTDSIKVFPERFQDFVGDSAREFSRGNKPPWAPNVSPHTQRMLKEWISMEVWDKEHLENQDWYAFLQLVAGAAVGGNVAMFLDSTDQSQSTRAVAPSRVGDRSYSIGGDRGGGSDFQALGQLGTAGMMSPNVRLDGTPTLFEPSAVQDGRQWDSVSAPPRGPTGTRTDDRNTSADDASEVLVADPRGTFIQAPSTRPPPRAMSSRDEFTLLMQSPRGATASETDALGMTNPAPVRDQLAAVLSRASRAAAESSRTPLAQSGARYKLERADMDLLHAAPWYADGASEEAREQRRQARINAQRALPWVGRSLATGVYYINPTYTYALEAAYGWTQQYGGAGVHNTPRDEFMRRRTRAQSQTTSASDSVRTLFANLVAEAFAQRRDRAGKGLRFQHDSAGITASINGLLDTLRRYYYYDASVRAFFDKRYHPRESSRYSESGPPYDPFQRDALCDVERRSRGWQWVP